MHDNLKSINFLDKIQIHSFISKFKILILTTLSK
jgi:hypothetical protein